jgi:hypothetical protein
VRKLRIDTAVVATAIHYPSNNTLPADGVPVLSRSVQQRLARAVFRQAYRWRAGIVEGRMSFVKQRFGLDRCRYRGEAGMERWVFWGLLAQDLRQIGRSLTVGLAR